MKLTSPAFGDRQLIPAKYTCDGKEVSPPLVIADVPERAKSLVLVVDDPDAPSGTWIHWTVWNIDPGLKEIPEGARPAGGAIEGVTSFGRTGWGGPCPPSGEHRYFFKLFALDMKLELPPDTTAEQLETAMVGHVMEQAELVGIYSRST